MDSAATPMSSIDPRTYTARNSQQFTIRTARPEDAEAMLAYIRSVAGASRAIIGNVSFENGPPFGMVVLALSPLIAGKLRGVI